MSYRTPYKDDDDEQEGPIAPRQKGIPAEPTPHPQRTIPVKEQLRDIAETVTPPIEHVRKVHLEPLFQRLGWAAKPNPKDASSEGGF